MRSAQSDAIDYAQGFITSPETATTKDANATELREALLVKAFSIRLFICVLFMFYLFPRDARPSTRDKIIL